MPVCEYDVLVIGSGIAGLVSAIVCRQAGLRVAVCSKSRPGSGSCSAISQGIFRTSASGLSPAEHKRLTVEAGQGINQMDRVDILVGHAEQAVRSLKEYGVRLDQRSGGYDSRPEKFGQEGLSITKPLAHFAASIGVELLSPFYVQRIADIDGRAAGVLGLSGGEEEPSFLSAGAVILATGGAGALFARTDNPQGMIGDGYALALNLGLPLLDMEFIQFYPLCLASTTRSSRLLPPLLGDVGELVNAAGENVAVKHNIEKRPLAVAARDELCQAMAKEVLDGNDIDGRLELRISRDDGVWDRVAKSFGYTDLNQLRFWTEKLLDGRGSLPVMPASHFCMGGVAVDEDCRTGLPGLFAAGEVAGGLHGANRYGGNALSEAVVFAGRVGTSAAEFARGGGSCSEKALRQWCNQNAGAQSLSAPAAKSQGTSLSDLKQELRQLLWREGGVLRSAGSLQRALSGLARLRESLEGFEPGPRDSIRSHELSNMLSVAEAVVQSALHRRESRGAHFRTDFPENRERFRGHFYVRMDPQLRIEFVEARENLEQE